MIDFQTLTSLFSNCGSRLVAAADCCMASTAAVAAQIAAASIMPFQNVVILPPQVSERQDPRCVLTHHLPPIALRDVEPFQRLQHLRNAADLVRVVAAGQDVIDAGEAD